LPPNRVVPLVAVFAVVGVTLLPVKLPLFDHVVKKLPLTDIVLVSAASNQYSGVAVKSTTLNVREKGRILLKGCVNGRA